jgi:tetratricopeptide (TPR) repeat protein
MNSASNILDQLQSGLLKHQAGDLAGAEIIYRHVLSSCPDQPDALHLLGAIALQCRNYSAAEELIAQAIRVFPGKAEFHVNYGLTLFEQKRAEEAAAAFTRAIAINPKLANAHNDLGNALVLLGRRDEAISAFKNALLLEPGNAQAAFNLGNALELSGRWNEAIESFRLATTLRPQWREANNNLGRALCREGRFDEAAEVCRLAVERRPDCPLSHFNHAIMLLRRADFARGLPEYEWRAGVKELGLAPPPGAAPRWGGSNLKGRRLLVYAEQGLGDTIQFVRYVALIKGGEVLLAVQPELKSLLGGVDVLTQCDFQCPLPSLPMIFGTELPSIPADVPYVRANPENVMKWRKRLPENRLKVGLCWAGRAIHAGDLDRSIRLAQLSPLAKSGAYLVSLQKGEAAAQIAAAGFEVTDWTGELNDFSDTAALVENLDLVVTVDTSVAHLAGAMGKKVWVLLPLAADWRWMLTREDSPWYPTMRLFRQEKSGDWTGAIQRVSEALREL